MRTKSGLISALLVACLTLTGCTANPVKTAETTEQKADALYGTFVIAQRRVVTIMENPAVPDDVKRVLAGADRAAKPVADDLYEGILAYANVVRLYKEALGAGENPDPKLLADAELALQKLVAETTADILKYTNEVEKQVAKVGPSQ